jgi:Tol biopolymer transport system component
MLAVVCACRLRFDAGARDGDVTDAFEPQDAPADAPPPTGPFGTTIAVTELNSGDADDATLTGDQLEIVFNTTRAPNVGGNDLFTARRAAVGDTWSMIASVTPLNTTGDDATPEISRDGLTLFFVANGAAGMKDMYVATRADRTSEWGGKTRIVELSTAADESGPTLTPDLLTMYLSTNAGGDEDLYVATRASIGATWSTPVLVSVNSPTANDAEPFINGTNTLLLFASDRGGNYDIWMARRATPTDPWGTPEPVSELNTTGEERDPWLSPDERTIYFARNNAIVRAER